MIYCARVRAFICMHNIFNNANDINNNKTEPADIWT